MTDSLAIPESRPASALPRKLTFGGLFVLGFLAAIGWYGALAWLAFHFAALVWRTLVG